MESDGVLQRIRRQRTQPCCGAAAEGHPDAGDVPAPTQCELCLGTSGWLNYHNEDYSKPFDVHPICWGCHRPACALHQARALEKRKQIVRDQREAAGLTTEGCWWEELTLEPIDINPRRQSGSVSGQGSEGPEQPPTGLLQASPGGARPPAPRLVEIRVRLGQGCRPWSSTLSGKKGDIV